MIYRRQTRRAKPNGESGLGLRQPPAAFTEPALRWLIPFLCCALQNCAPGNNGTSPATPAPVAAKKIPPPPPPRTLKRLVNRDAKFTVLAYNGFATEPGDLSLTTGSELQNHLTFLQNKNVATLTLDDYLAWKDQRRDLSERNALITIDLVDQVFFSHALPQLRKHGAPFLAFATAAEWNALTPAERESIVIAGGEIGLLGSARRDLTLADRDLATRLAQARDSVTALGDWSPRAFAFPYGLYDDTSRAAAVSAEFELLFTLEARHLRWDTSPHKIARFPVPGGPGGETVLTAAFQDPERRPSVPVTELIDPQPAPHSLSITREPLISANLKSIATAAGEIRVYLSGFGLVPHTFDSDTGLLTCQPVGPVRSSDSRVQIDFGVPQSNHPPLQWEFSTDLSAAYLSNSQSH